jgi:thioredoxin 1
MTKEVKAVTKKTFEKEVVQSTLPVIVDFYADWCGPCRAVGPIVAELAADYAGKVEVRKIDVDSSPELADRFRIRSIPTLILFKEGAPQEVIVGAVSKQRLTETIDRHVAWRVILKDKAAISPGDRQETIATLSEVG